MLPTESVLVELHWDALRTCSLYSGARANLQMRVTGRGWKDVRKYGRHCELLILLDEARARVRAAAEVDDESRLSACEVFFCGTCRPCARCRLARAKPCESHANNVEVTDPLHVSPLSVCSPCMLRASFSCQLITRARGAARTVRGTYADALSASGAGMHFAWRLHALGSCFLASFAHLDVVHSCPKGGNGHSRMRHRHVWNGRDRGHTIANCWGRVSVVII